MRKTTMLVLGIVLGINTIGFGTALAAQKDLLAAVNETTLGIVFAGAIIGAIARSVLGWLDERKEKKDLAFDAGSFFKTIVFGISAGVGAAIGYTTLLEVDVTASLVKQIVLLFVVFTTTIGLDKLKKDTTG